MTIRMFAMWTARIAVYMLAIVVSVAESQAQPKYTKEMIAKAWQERQDRTPSASFTWKERLTEAAGSVSYYWKVVNPKVTEVIPPEDTSIQRICSLRIDRNKLSYSHDTREWSKKTNDYEPLTYRAVFDGSTCKVLYEYGPNHESYWPQGIIRAETQHIDVRQIRLQPLLMSFRGLAERMHAFDLDRFQISAQTTLIDGRPCLELYQRIPEVNIENYLWVDPSRDFVIVRFLGLTRDNIRQRTDVTYHKGQSMQWEPIEWRVVSNFPNGKLRRAYHATTARVDTQAVIAQSDFDLEFPLGTRVTDAKGNLDYIIRPDGSGKRMIARSEIGATYEEALNSQTGKALQPGKLSGGSVKWSWPTIVFVVVGVGLSALLFWRRFRRRP